MHSAMNSSVKKKHILFTVNGKRVEADVDHRMTLAELLREELDLTGTKVGCNRGECGSCTVIMDGMAVYSCTTLAVEAAGREVQTIEGLGSVGELHPIQESFIEHDALQCGFCTPGMILSVKALLDRKALPTELDIRTAVDGNLCRCGSVPNIIEATLEASRRMAKKKGG
jgi:aerobic-type carbon monoxide dehydrogenase small subunit (CoxS/CutS family)